MKIFLNRFSLRLETENYPEISSKEVISFAQLSEELGSVSGNSLKCLHSFSNNEFSNPSEVFSFITSSDISSKQLEWIIYFPSEDSLEIFLKEFSSKFKLVFAAGGLVLNPENELLLIFRLGLWDLPKGKIEENESPNEAAIREVEEETGLKGTEITAFADTTFHIFLIKEKWRFKTTFWFYMKVTEKQKLIPQLDENITEVKWMPIVELNKTIPETYPLVGELIRAACAKYPG